MTDSGPVRRFDLGGCTATLLSGGSLKLDGGAMFGVVPKVLWSRTTPADEQNRIPLACNCLLVEWQRETARRVIVETGHGPKYAAKDQQIFAIDPAKWLVPSLRMAGVDPATITDVVLTHLHFDHAGGLTMPAAPAFPRARVHVQRQEFDDARANFGIMTMTYREENFLPIDAAGAWNQIDGDAQLFEGLCVLHTPGHTRGHQSVLIEGRHRAVLFLGDVMPTRCHVGPAYNMGYDLFPLDNRDTKRRILEMAADRDWLIVIGHEPHTPVVRVIPDGDYYGLIPVENA